MAARHRPAPGPSPRCRTAPGIVKLSVQLMLTTGESVPLPVWDEVALCKK